MTTIASTRDQGAATATRRDTGLAKSTVTVARRALLRYVRTPQLIVLATVQMSLFFLIYRYMFGGAIHIAGMPYVDYLVPGFLATGVLFSGMGTAAAMAEDLEQGFIDRLRSLPIPRAAVLTARATADTALVAWSTAFTTAVAFAVGFSLHGSAIDGLAAFGLVIAFGFAFEWLFITMGLFAGNAQAAQGMGMIVFPFAFVSSAYVPVSSMPSWLQVFANHQPLTYMVDSVRALTLGPHAHALLGHPSSYFVTRALLWALAIIAVTAPASPSPNTGAANDPTPGHRRIGPSVLTHALRAACETARVVVGCGSSSAIASMPSSPKIEPAARSISRFQSASLAIAAGRRLAHVGVPARQPLLQRQEAVEHCVPPRASASNGGRLQRAVRHLVGNTPRQFAVDLDVKLESVDVVGDPKRLLGASVAGGQSHRAWRQRVAVAMPVQDLERLGVGTEDGIRAPSGSERRSAHADFEHAVLDYAAAQRDREQLRAEADTENRQPKADGVADQLSLGRKVLGRLIVRRPARRAEHDQSR